MELLVIVVFEKTYFFLFILTHWFFKMRLKECQAFHRKPIPMHFCNRQVARDAVKSLRKAH